MGKGPSVSVGATVQVVFPVPEFVTVPVPEGSSIADELDFLQASSMAGEEMAPMMRLFKKTFLSIFFLFRCVEIPFDQYPVLIPVDELKMKKHAVKWNEVSINGRYVSINQGFSHSCISCI